MSVTGSSASLQFSATELEVPDGADLASNPDYVRARSTIEHADLFDAAFFGILPKEAELIDPQQRVFLECCWEALEDAGYDPYAYPGAIAVYAGCSANTYFLRSLCTDPRFIEEYTNAYQVGHYPTLLGTNHDFLATRVSYKLNLKGPSFTVQCGCSTSLVAVCQACQGLLSYQSDMALAGGVSITFPQKRGYFYQDGGMGSKDGHCRTFDADAQGTVFGSGSGVVLLKRLEDALVDGDHIYAVIKGFAVNNDGSVKVGYTAPSVEGQANVIAMAHAVAGVDPESITYIEAHGTATPLGDPIEFAALTPRVPSADQGQRLLRPWHSEDECRPSGHRFGCDRPDQRGPGTRSRTTASGDQLQVAEPEHRPREQPVLREHTALSVEEQASLPAELGSARSVSAARMPTSWSRKRPAVVRRASPGRPLAGPIRQDERSSRRGHRQSGPASERASRDRSRFSRIYPSSRSSCVRPPQSGGLQRSCRRNPDARNP